MDGVYYDPPAATVDAVAGAFCSIIWTTKNAQKTIFEHLSETYFENTHKNVRLITPGMLNGLNC